MNLNADMARSLLRLADWWLEGSNRSGHQQEDPYFWGMTIAHPHSHNRSIMPRLVVV
jgi:hypothetical protein